MSKFEIIPVRINILINNNLRKKYKKYCIDNNYVLSERIRELIEMDLNGKIIDNKLNDNN